MKYKELSANTVAFVNSGRLQLTKATVLAESSLYLIFSPGYLCYCDVYRCESRRSRIPPFLKKYFLSFQLN